MCRYPTLRCRESRLCYRRLVGLDVPDPHIIGRSSMLVPLSAALLLLVAPSDEDGPPRPPVQVAVVQAQRVLDGALTDYPGARFRNVRAVTVSAQEDHTARPVQAVVFCGEVNAPNRMGGMSGWTPFYLRPDTVVFPFQTSTRSAPGLHPSCLAGGGDASDQTDYSSALTAAR